ncbi:MAG: glycerophosphodiester phosphodiesterase family protein [Pirellulales bacterium]|nr:glycerophosphodiester phosphodiesterase family protein [Pirellulales bacterium]
MKHPLLIGAALALALCASASAVEVVCHRGANEHAPENTYAAAQLCIDWGVDYVEIDVRTSQDGVMYILHDPSVDRTTDGHGLLRSLSSAEIDRLDAGSWFDPKFANERVPRLEPYLRWIKGRAKVYFDVKDCDLQALIDLVYTVGLERDCFFWFGANKAARRFRELDQQLALKVNAATPEEVERAVTELQAGIIETGLARLTPEMLDACHRRGAKLMVLFTEKDRAGFRRIIEGGADMVNLDHGDVFLEVQRELAGASGN